jgi:hypothetical protein
VPHDSHKRRDRTADVRRRAGFMMILRNSGMPRAGAAPGDPLHRRYLRRECRKPHAWLRAEGLEAGLMEGRAMPDVTIVYWRDIPAQVIVGKGRRGTKAPLPERFEQAIDRAAMKAGARDTDAYLAEWRKGDPYPVEGTPEEVAAAEAAKLETSYDTARLKALIDNEGWA